MKLAPKISLAFMLCTVGMASAQKQLSSCSFLNSTFTLPETMVVSEASEEKFTASNALVHISVFAVEEENHCIVEMHQNLLTWARENELTHLTSPESITNLNGYKGAYMEGFFEDYPVLLMQLEDPDFKNQNLYVWLSYHPENEDEALALANSFSPDIAF